MAPPPLLWVLLLGMGCTRDNDNAAWTEAAAVAPTLSRLDGDRDGRIRADELDAVAHGGDFARLNTDGDAQLSAGELLAWMSAADPLTFDGEMMRRPIVIPDLKAASPPDRRSLLLEELLSFLAAEVRAADPEAPVPTPYHLQQAARTGDIQHPEVQAILRGLHQSYGQAGRPFPAALLPLISAEVTP